MNFTKKICAPRFALMMIALAATACSSTARRDETVATPVPLTAQQQQGQSIFMIHCNQCHVGGAAGIGPALNDKPLPEWAMKYQVRHGLGPMPAFPTTVIDDDQLEAVIRYLKAIRSRNVQVAAEAPRPQKSPTPVRGTGRW